MQLWKRPVKPLDEDVASVLEGEPRAQAKNSQERLLPAPGPRQSRDAEKSSSKASTFAI